MDREKEPNDKTKPSPEKLNHYIRIGSVKGYLIIAVLVLMAAALIVWAFAGRIPVTSTQIGVVVDKENTSHSCLSFVDAMEGISEIPQGTEVTITMIDNNTYEGTVKYMGDKALPVDEVWEAYSVGGDMALVGLTDWIKENLLGDSKYVYPLFVETEEDISEYWHQTATVTLILYEVRPISYLLGN